MDWSPFTDLTRLRYQSNCNLFTQRNEPGRRKHEGQSKISGAHDNTERERKLTERKQREQDWGKRKQARRTTLRKKRQEGKHKIFPPKWCGKVGDLI
jgi:hypothetical protein